MSQNGVLFSNWSYANKIKESVTSLIEDKSYNSSWRDHVSSKLEFKYKLFNNLEKKRKPDVETWTIDIALYKEYFHIKIYRECEPGSSPRSLFDFGKQLEM